MTDDGHTCSYECERPECIRRQRDELRGRCERLYTAVRRNGLRRISNTEATTCDECHGIWFVSEPERHAEGCLAA